MLHGPAWKRVEPVVVSWLEERKRERLQRLKNEAIRKRLRELDAYVLGLEPANGYFFSSVDVARMTKFCELIDVSPDINMTKADFEALTPMLNLAVARWLRELKHELRTKVRAEVDSIAPDVDPLKLAVGAYWQCTRCKPCDRPLAYPQVLAHRCNTEPLVEDTTYGHLVKEVLQHRRALITAKHLRPLSPFVKAAVTAFGMDPRTTTPAQLDDVPKRCREKFRYSHLAPGRIVVISTWRSFVSATFNCRVGMLTGI